MAATSRGHAVVVGAGVVGLASADALARDGWRVTLLDAALGPGRDGASFGNAGMIVPSHVLPLAQPGVFGRSLHWLLDPESPFYVAPRADLELLRWGWRFWRSATPAHVARTLPRLHALHQAGAAAHVALAERLALPAPERRGLVMLCATEAGWREARHEAEVAARAGVAAQVLDAAEVAACYPGVDVRAVGGVHYPDDGHRSPGALMRAWQERLPDGATIRWGARAVAWRRRGAEVAAVALENGAEVAGDAFVLAGGHATPELARALGLRLPIQSGRGYSVTVTDPPQRPTVPAILVEGRVAMTPLPEGVRFGGTMEIAPADRPVDPRRVRGIAKAAARTFPAFEADALAALPVWSGARPVSPDGLPYVGRLRRAPNVAVAAGHGMMGFSLGPVTGELVADLFAERAPRVPLDGLEPERFAGG